MNVERSLNIIAAATACMGTAMLGVGEENYLLVMLAMVVSLGSLYLCDLKKWFHLNNTGSNIAALAMLAIAVAQLRSASFEQRVLVMADLLGYLQFVLQFRPKTTRNYWLLLLVSFLQTCVAAALHTGIAFGVMLTMYLFCGIFFLGYFYFYREQAKFDAESARARRQIEQRGAGFIGQSTSKLPSDALRGEFSRRMTGIVFGTIALSVFFFCAVPRAGQSNWSAATLVGERTVGFTPEINLTRGGEITEDPKEVMQVRFFDARTSEPYQISGELYMRGMSLARYARGRWEQGIQGRSEKREVPAYAPDASIAERVRQTITIEPLSTETLFAAAPAFSVPSSDTSKVAYNATTGQLFRTAELRVKRYQYELQAPGIVNHQQATLTAATVKADKYPEAFGELLQTPRRTSDGDPLPGLKATAEAIVRDLPEERVYERAKRIESYLRDSGRFSYTMEPPQRPAGVDPLEDFVTAQPSGHCEFFAGALTMMLRSVGIRSRIVLGYRGGEYNVVGNFYQFQQLHAHSWVEAYIPPESIPANRLISERAKSDARTFGAWLQLDGTPAGSIVQSSASNSRWYEIIQITDYVRFLWGNYVVGMDSMRQQESIYQPVIEAISDFWHSLTSKEAWRARGKTVRGIFDFTDAEYGPARRTSLLVLGCAAIVLGGAIWIRKRLPRRANKRIVVGKAAAAAAPAPEIDFYRRLETLLKGFEHVRLGNQTQREFAASAGTRLATLPQAAEVVALPKFIVEAFYRVRFGKQELEAAERTRVEQALNELDDALAARRSGR